ncbi:PASTA domain-containing protein, partial [Microbacterium sp.]|uniref:PASTA domain-containing protein n=1 Tax=Microbacterium sp. TaxID=51671 RepID=UPI0027361A00
DRVPANYDNQHFGGAGVTIEPATGRILAITQNTTFQETPTEDQAYSSLVYASDYDHGGSAGFPVGSTYKLFTLIDWLETGHSVNESLNGRHQTLNMNVCEGQTQPLDTSEINNFDNNPGYYGTPMRFTKDSLNSGYFAMASKLEVCDINAVADRMGVTTWDPDAQKVVKTTDFNYPYNVLGDKYISPLDMAGAYATVANKGIYCAPKAIDRVINQKGEELPVPETACSQVISPEVAATAAYALQGVMDSGGTGQNANPYDGTPLLGKTGSHETYATMMIESSTKATTAVYIGRTEGFANIWNEWHYDNELQSIRYDVARDMQAAANAALGGGDEFPRPDDNLTRRVLVDLPNVVGQTVGDATATLESAGFSVNVGPEVDSDAAKGIIATQDPGAGQVSSGTTVTISPSNGQGATVPDVSGKPLADAVEALKAAGFTSVTAHASCSAGDDDDAKTVKSSSPAAGTATKKSTAVTVKCS